MEEYGNYGELWKIMKVMENYGRLWDELSAKDREVLKVICNKINETGNDIIKIDDIRNELHMSSSTFSTYRKRLVEKGIIDGNQFGYVKFDLPGFSRFTVLQ